MSAYALVLLFPFAVTYGSHFWGGSMTFSPKGVEPDGSYRVEFRFKQTFHSCGYFGWNTCVSGDCGNETSLQKGVIYQTDGRNVDNLNWCQTEGVMMRKIPYDNPFSLSEKSCCWVALANNFGNWRLLTVVNLGNRSDTHKANRSPVTTSISFVRVPQNCPRTYTLVTFDPDNDQGRCRYGSRQDEECGGCQLPAGFTLGQTRINQKDFCNLTYNSASAGVYGFELVVEDFPQQNIIVSYNNGSSFIARPFGQSASPLSQLPLHFAVKVDPAIASCEEGVYLPRFLPPTPENGQQVQAVINQQLEIIINATASEIGVRGIIISGPLNVTVQQNATGHFTLRWTPRSEDLGEYFPICFIAESNPNNSTYYQSNMRCILVEVRTSADVQYPVPAEEKSNDVVVGLRMTVESLASLSEVDVEEKIIKPFKEELVRNGLPNTTTLSVRQFYRVNP